MNPKNNGRKPIYDADRKIAIAREYLTSSLGYGELAKKHGLPLETVRNFVKWYRKHYSADPHSPTPIETDLVASSENKQLAAELKQANLKITALEMLIETARKELGIDIVKKSGTKRSSK